MSKFRKTAGKYRDTYRRFFVCGRSTLKPENAVGSAKLRRYKFSKTSYKGEIARYIIRKIISKNIFEMILVSPNEDSGVIYRRVVL